MFTTVECINKYSKLLKFTLIFFMFAADTPPPAYMPPDEQMGQDNSQSMDTSNTMIPQIMPNISTRGKLYSLL